MKTKISLLLILSMVIIVVSCKKNETLKDEANEKYSSTPVLPATPDNYTSSGNDRLATLGRVLFYDRALSLNNSVSCASCHQQTRAFCDNLQFSPGLENQQTSRNTPSIFAKSGRMFWDGRADNMSNLVLKPIKNHVEMRFEDLNQLASKISKINYYPALFAGAFGDDYIDSSRVRQALAEFIKNFNFSNNRFARHQKNQATLNASETLGKLMFFGKARCSNCHHIESNSLVGPIFDSTSTGGGYGFTDDDFNIGLDKVYADNGIGSISNQVSDNGKFMVPVLLNIELTAPYMHDGRFKTLEEVVEHYNSGIKNHPNLDIFLRDIDLENLDNGITEQQLLTAFDSNHNGQLDELEIQNIPPVKLNLSDAEKKGLVDFLKTLTDPAILTDAKFKNPFVKAN